jgi:RND family efflux transporter MFP subunit
MKGFSKGGWWIAGAAAILATVLILRFKGPAGRNGVAEAEAAGQVALHQESASSAPQRLRVSVVRPREGGIVRITDQPGTMESYDFADLYAKVSGYLEEQSLHGAPVDIGTAVKRGDVLATIEVPELLEEMHRAEAAQQQAQAEVVQAKSRVDTAVAEADAAEAAIDLAKAEVGKAASYLKFRNIQVERIKKLYDEKAVDARLLDEKYEQRDSAEAAESAAKAAVVSSKAQAVAARARIAQAKADVEDAEAKVGVAKALVAKAAVFVKYMKIVSPYDGVVTKRNYHVGDFVRTAEQGQTLPMFTVARTDKMRIIVQVPERDVPYTNVGDKAIVELDALAGMEFKGTVARFSNSEDRTSRTMRVEIDLDNPNNRLRDGMFGRVKIVVDEATKGLTVPSSSIIAEAKKKGYSVFVVRDGKLERKPIEKGQDDGQRTEILSGLTVSDNVVRKPTVDLTNGLAVDVEQAAASSEALANSSRHK